MEIPFVAPDSSRPRLSRPKASARERKPRLVSVDIREAGVITSVVDAFDLTELKDESSLFTYHFRTRDKAEPPVHSSDRHAVKIIYPLYDSSRLLAQDGALTLHADLGARWKAWLVRSSPT